MIRENQGKYMITAKAGHLTDLTEKKYTMTQQKTTFCVQYVKTVLSQENLLEPFAHGWKARMAKRQLLRNTFFPSCSQTHSTIGNMMPKGFLAKLQSIYAVGHCLQDHLLKILNFLTTSIASNQLCSSIP